MNATVVNKMIKNDLNTKKEKMKNLNLKMKNLIKEEKMKNLNLKMKNLIIRYIIRYQI